MTFTVKFNDFEKFLKFGVSTKLKKMFEESFSEIFKTTDKFLFCVTYEIYSCIKVI